MIDLRRGQPLEPAILAALADELFTAAAERRTVAPLSDRYPAITIGDAYGIQERIIERRIAGGDRVVGQKIGLTSKAFQERFGVNEPDYGRLLASTAYHDGATIPISTLIQPMAEGEIAFVLRDDLEGPYVTPLDVLRATEAVVPCFEIVDSRIADWKIKIQDTIADNSSAAAFVLGNDLHDPTAVDLFSCGMVLERNGEIAALGAGAASLGSPLIAMAWLANAVHAYGSKLRAGEIVLSGALASPLPVLAGDSLRLTIGGLGTASVRFSS